MTDLECKKICKVLGIRDIWLADDGVVTVKNNANDIGRVYIYEESFNSALPYRMLRMRKSQDSKKHMLELLLNEAENGIRSYAVFSQDGACIKSKLISANESFESLLVKYDMKFSMKHKKSKKA